MRGGHDEGRRGRRIRAGIPEYKESVNVDYFPPAQAWAAQRVPRAALWCSQCGTDEHLIIESIDTLRPPRAGLVEVTYTCVECDFFYAHTASVAGVADFLNRPGQRSGVLQFGGNYLHCGEPMTMAGSQQRSVHATLSTEQTGEGPLEVYLRIRVLHCSCGFQMENTRLTPSGRGRQGPAKIRTLPGGKLDHRPAK